MQTTSLCMACVLVAFASVCGASCAAAETDPTDAPQLESKGPRLSVQDDDEEGAAPPLTDTGATANIDEGSAGPISSTSAGTGASSPGSPDDVNSQDDAEGRNPRRLKACLDLASASVPERENFCRSLRNSDARERCWANRWDRYRWSGWCYSEFS
jgi:hypothetical protein